MAVAQTRIYNVNINRYELLSATAIFYIINVYNFMIYYSYC